MAIYYYNPPELNDEGEPFPPLVLESDGLTKVVYAHKYWHRVDQPYIVEYLYDARGNPVMDAKKQHKAKTRIKSAWVLDEKRNAEMEAGKIGKPENFIELNSNDWHCLQRDKFAGLREHLISREKVERESRKSLEELRRAQFDESENERKLIHEQKEKLRRLRAERETMIAAETAEIEAMKSTTRKSSSKRE